MRRTGKVIFYFLPLFIASAAVAEVSIETSVSRSRVAIGEELVLDFIITNANGPISKPTFPPLDGFTSYSQGHSQEISIINGQTSSKSIFSYVLIPNSAGRKTLGPFEIVIGGKLFKVAPIEVDVVQSTGYQPSGPASSYVQSQTPISAPNPRALPSGGVTDQDIFVRAWLDKDEAYVNEPVTLTYTLYTRLSATYKGFEKEPVTTGFWVEDFPPEKTIKRTEQFFNGSRYVVADVRKLVLFPTEAGVFTIDPGTLSAVVELRDEDDFDSFFSYNIFGYRNRPMRSSFLTQMVQRSLSTDKVSLVAKALPEASRPASFTGAVGRYEVESSIDKDEVEAGTPVTFRVRVRGEGNVNTVGPPMLSKLEDFKIYDSSTSTNVSKDRLLVEGEKITETVIVPKKAGTYTIPALVFSYFDPRAETYRESKTASHMLTVKPGAEPAAPGAEEEGPPPGVGVGPVEKESVTLVGQDIHFIKTSDLGIFARAVPFYRRPWYWGLNVFLALFTALFGWLVARKDAFSGGLKFLFFQSPYRTARRRLRAAATHLNKGKRDEFYEEASRAVYGYLAERLATPAQAVTMDLVEARVADDTPPKTLNDLRALFNRLAHGRYSRAEEENEKLKELLRSAESVLAGFEKVKIK